MCIERQRIRKQYGIEGGVCGDCWGSMCCVGNVLTQSELETIARTQNAPAAPQEPYQTVDGMRMPVQARRRPHTKSRHGCVRCKQKHVKCDEVRPTCGTCVRYEVPCAYPPRHAPRPSSQTRGQAQGVDDASPETIAPCSNSKSTSPASDPTQTGTGTGSLSPAPTANHQPRSVLTLWEFDLLHHWIINVADSFDISPGLHRDFRDHAVTAATRFEFFMHMILILSALHLALTKSPKFTDQHRAFIMDGCSDTMAAFQLEATHITEDNCEEIQAFHTLVAIYALALAQFGRNEKGANEETVVDEFLQIIVLMKSNRAIKNTAHPIVQAKQTNRWFVEEESSSMPTVVCGMNTRAAAMVSESISYRLRRNFRPFVWPNFVDDDFLGLLTARNPMALVIFAHNAVILDQSRSLWWCANWGVRIVSAVASCLPDKFMPAIAFPMQSVGLA
ncbi:hypothetical protein BJX62DRAFT_238502 [Aspergillus germanicus]